MNILIVTNHFYPESFRINDLADSLVERGHKVSVLTGTPNYPEGKYYIGYGPFTRWRDRHHGIYIYRAPLIPRGKGKSFNLALNYISYAISSCLLAPFLALKQLDVILVFETSPITVGLPALIVKKIKKIPILFWVQDLWPESLSATGAVRNKLALKVVEKLVSFIYKGCDQILIQSKAFTDSVMQYAVETHKLYYFPNSAECFYRPISIERDAEERNLVPVGFNVMFAGNIGAAQDVGTILSAAEILKSYNDINFIFIGDGRMRPWLEDEVEKRGLKETVHLLGRHPTERMPRFFSLADVLLVTLRKEPIFALTIPSKLQSYFACGKPVIAALDGEGARIVDESGAGLSCPAEDPKALAESVSSVYGMSTAERDAMGKQGKKYFDRHFERNILANRLQDLMLEAIHKQKHENNAV